LWLEIAKLDAPARYFVSAQLPRRAASYHRRNYSQKANSTADARRRFVHHRTLWTAIERRWPPDWHAPSA